MIRILMDERERHEIRRAMEALECDLCIKTLDVGDFVLSPDIGIERKRGDDFTASLIDNRLFTQAFRMKKIFKTPLIILENLNSAFKRKEILPQSIYGAMSYLNYKLRIPILLSESAEQTALMILSLATHLQAKGIFPPEDLGFMTLRSDRITRTDQLYFLQGLLEVGEKRAEQLLTTFGCPAGVLKAIKDTEIIYSKSGLPKGIKGSLEACDGIGPKFIQHNLWLFKPIHPPTARLGMDLRTLIPPNKPLLQEDA